MRSVEFDGVFADLVNEGSLVKDKAEDGPFKCCWKEGLTMLVQGELIQKLISYVNIRENKLFL